MGKILLLVPTMEIGGAEKQAIAFAKYLSKHRISVLVAGVGEYGKLKTMCEQESVDCISLIDYLPTKIKTYIARFYVFSKIKVKPERFLTSYAKALISLVNNGGYTSIITYCALSGTIAGIAKLLCNKLPPYIWYQRDAGIYNYHHILQSFAIRNATKILANSLSGQKWIKATYGLDSIVIRNGVELKKPVYTKEQWRKKLGVDDGCIVVTMVANLTGVKDHETLLKAWKLVVNEVNHQCKLVLAGKKNNKYLDLQKYVDENKLNDSVIFLGQVDDISGLYAISSICAFSAISEGSPNGLIEGCLSSLPVVATDLPEIRDCISQENFKYLFKKGDYNSCAYLLVELINNYRSEYNLGKQNNEKAKKLFYLNENFKNLLYLIENK